MTLPSDKKKDQADDDKEVDTSRRDFLKVAMTLSAVFAIGGIGTVLKSISNPAPPGSSSLTFPRIKVADTTIAVNSPVYFYYPLDSEPNFLVRLGQPALGGVGPGQDIVAFSQLCQHAGCPNIYYQTQDSVAPYGPVANCHCHGSIFDLLHSAKVLRGPSPLPLPQVQLEVDQSGKIFAKGMGPPIIYGHTSDLQGGNVVG